MIEELKDFYFVIIGGGDFSKCENDMLNKIKNRIFHFSYISEKSLNILYNNASCLLYPSSYEGFGIPIAEAMKAGCPVISSNRSSIPEVAGAAALLVENLTKDAFKKQISKLENPIFRAKLINKGFLQCQKFDWQICANQTFNFYKKIYMRKFG